MDKKTEIKTELAGIVARKMEITRERLALKRIPFKERTEAQHNRMFWCWREGACLKEAIRVLQLAYAFVRGVPYWVQERSPRWDEKTRKGWARSVAGPAGATEEAVVAWMEAPVSPEDRAAFEAHLAHARAREHERRQARARAQAA